MYNYCMANLGNEHGPSFFHTCELRSFNFLELSNDTHQRFASIGRDRRVLETKSLLSNIRKFNTLLEYRIVYTISLHSPKSTNILIQ